MNKICTSIEQSQKLMKLGLDINTADMYWEQIDQTFVPNVILIKGVEHEYLAWSLSALLELIPLHINIRIFEDGTFGFSKAANEEAYIAYYTKYYENGFPAFLKTIIGNTAIDAVFEMICWLLKNKKI